MKEKLKVCPFCGVKPNIDKSYLPTEVYIECVNNDCFVRPCISEGVECVDNGNKTFSPLFEKSYPIIISKWNKRF